MTRYAGDPHWIEARHPGNCRSCGGPFARGERVFYWPRQRAVSCGVCGEVAHAAVLCPSFYRVRVSVNPGRWARLVGRVRRAIIGALAPA